MPKNMLEDIKPISRGSRPVPVVKREPAPRKTKPTPAPRVPREIPFTPKPATRSSRHGLWYIAVICVIGFLFSLSFIFEHATVSIVPKSVPVVFDASDTFTANKDSLSPDDIIYTVTISADDASMTLPSTDEKKIAEKAVGTVVLYNSFTTTPYKITKGTRLQATNGQIYRTNQLVSIPGYTKVSSGIIPGSIEVAVTADTAGEAGNLSVGDFSLPALTGLPQSKKIYGRSKSALSGGVSGTVYVVAQETADVAVNTLSGTLKKSLIAKAKVQVPTGYLFFEGATKFTADDKAQILYSKDKNVPITISGTLTAYLIKEDSLAQAITKKFVSQYGGEPVVVEKLGTMKLNTSQPLSEGTDVTFTFSLSGSTYITWLVDAKNIQTLLAGKKKSDFQSILGNVLSISRADVVLKPFWKQSFPEDASRITVDLKPAHE
jgi:hypothetical protein